MESKIIIQEQLINNSQFIGVDLRFIEVLGNGLAPTLRPLKILLQLHNTGTRMAIAVTHKVFLYFVSSGRHGYEWHHGLSNGAEDRI